MDDLAKYRKILHRKRVKRWDDFFKQKKEIITQKNPFVKIIYWLPEKLLKGLVGIGLYADYITYRFRNFTFDANYLEYLIQARAMSTKEAISFLNEQNIKLKEYIYREIISKKEQVKAEKSLDYVLTRYSTMQKENPVSLHFQPSWIEIVWQNLLSKKCIEETDKSNFSLIMTNNNPVQKLIWSKGLSKLVQFVEEGIAVEKIKMERYAGRDQFIANYIITNFRPNPNLPNQKLENYTLDRIKNAHNEMLKNRSKDREFFIFNS